MAALLAGVIVLLGVAMFVYDHTRRDRIANGVSIAGVPVGGLSESAARAKLERDVVAGLSKPVTVHSGSHEWTLTARQAGVTVDAANMVSQAVEASRQGSIFTRTIRSLSGGSVHRDVPLVVSYSHTAVRRLTAQVRAAVNREPRDASVAPSASGLEQVAGENGLSVDSAKLGARIEGALTVTRLACRRRTHARRQAEGDDGSARRRISGVHCRQSRRIQAALLRTPETGENV